jgi:tetratricopeptide (TPR) repeat protein
MGIAGTAAMVLAVVVVIGVLVRFLRSPEEARASSQREGPPVQSAISARGGRASGARNPQSTIFWWYVAGILSGWAGVMTHGIFTLCIRIPANAYLLAFSAGIGLACAAALRLPVAPSPRRRVAASLLLSAGLLLVMGLTLPIAWWACAAGYAAQSARLAQESRAPTKQLHELLEAARLDPSYSMAHLELARIYDVLARSPLFAQKEFPEETPSTQELLAKAILRYQEAIATQPTNADFHSALASFLAWAPNLSKMQRIAKTDAAFKRAIYLAPNEDMFWFYLGVFYEGMGERARALACFQGGLNVRTRQLRPIVVMLTEHGASASEIERVLPGQPKCYVDAAELLAGMAKPKEARSILESGRRLLLSAVKGPAAVEEEGEKPPDLALANRIGRIYLAIGENSTAIAWLTQCIAAAEKEEKEGKHEKAQGNTELRRSLVAAFVKSGEWDKAVQEAKRLIDDEPSEAKNYMSMADALIAKGDLPGAEEQYRHALRMTPLDFWLVTSLFNLLKNEGQLNAACEVLDEFLRLGGTRIPRGELAQTYGLRALLFTAAGRYDEALMAYDRALFFEPQNTQFKNGRDAVLKKMALEKSRK